MNTYYQVKNIIELKGIFIDLAFEHTFVITVLELILLFAELLFLLTIVQWGSAVRACSLGMDVDWIWTCSVLEGKYIVGEEEFRRVSWIIISDYYFIILRYPDSFWQLCILKSRDPNLNLHVERKYLKSNTLRFNKYHAYIKCTFFSQLLEFLNF